MAPSHEWAEHTAELELRLEGGSEAAIFAEAARAVGELLAPDEVAGGDAEESIAIGAEASDRAALLAAWLEELLYVAESRSVIPVSVRSVELGQSGRVEGEIACRPGAPRPLVKAVTYHRLALERSGEGWRGRVVLDV